MLFAPRVLSQENRWHLGKTCSSLGGSESSRVCHVPIFWCRYTFVGVTMLLCGCPPDPSIMPTFRLISLLVLVLVLDPSYRSPIDRFRDRLSITPFEAPSSQVLPKTSQIRRGLSYKTSSQTLSFECFTQYRKSRQIAGYLPAQQAAIGCVSFVDASLPPYGGTVLQACTSDKDLTLLLGFVCSDAAQRLG